MGDRANIIVLDNDTDGKLNGVVLYTHWNGSEIVNTLRAALASKVRWDDGQYLTRIIFCEMIAGDVKGKTGYGISSYIGDNEHDFLVVDVPRQVVVVVPRVRETLDEVLKASRKKQGTPFKDF